MLVEIRMRRLALAKLIASLNLPKELTDDEDGEGHAGPA